MLAAFSMFGTLPLLPTNASNPFFLEMRYAWFAPGRVVNPAKMRCIMCAQIC